MWPAAAAIVACATGVPFLLFALRSKWCRRAPSGGGRLRVAFLHPDLGIGGAERLVVDAAVAMQDRGHQVEVFTARHERNHCFEETRDGTLKVVVLGDWLPRRVLGRFYALCAYIRMCWIALRLAVGSERYDVFFVDQVSVCIPILVCARASAIVFYCHFPDKLLTDRATVAKAVYRKPLDLAEEITTGMADVVFVNSNFTRGVFHEAFPLISALGVQPEVLYPPLNLEVQDELAANAQCTDGEVAAGDRILLSINRFERKKNIGLAIQAFAKLPEELRSSSRLVLAGGYDAQLPENVEYAAELARLAADLGVSGRVQQMRSISSAMKAGLLARADCLLYTPDREHLGIVPLEAMYNRLPVIAVASGGPLETVADGVTGMLRPQNHAAWAVAMQHMLGDAAMRRKMGDAGRERVAERFSLAAFSLRLDAVIHSFTSGPRPADGQGDKGGKAS